MFCCALFCGHHESIPINCEFKVKTEVLDHWGVGSKVVTWCGAAIGGTVESIVSWVLVASSATVVSLLSLSLNIPIVHW